MLRQTVQICTLVLLFQALGCRESDQTPAIPYSGRDTLFMPPAQYPDSSTIVRFADLDGDRWKDVVLGTMQTTPLTRDGNVQDSVIVFRFDPTAQQHKRTAAYADFGLVGIAIVQHRSIGQPIIVADLNGGGNDIISLGKVLLTLVGDSLRVIAYAPFGDPHLIEIDSQLVLEVHQSFSGWLAHYQAVEYADSLIAINSTAQAKLNTSTLLDKRISYYRALLDSLWLVRRSLTSEEQIRVVVSSIMSAANLESKRRGVDAAIRTLRTLRQRWDRVIPKVYRQLLDEFLDELATGFALVP